MMRFYRFMVLCVLAGGFSPEVLAETLKEKAHRVCHAFIEDRDSFVPVDSYECNIKRYEGDPVDWKQSCFDFSFPETNRQKTYSFMNMLGTCQSSAVVTLKQNNLLEFIPIRNSGVNGYGVGLHDQMFLYQGDLLVSNGGDLRLITEQDQIVLCEFLYRSTGWNTVNAGDGICQKFGDNEFSTNYSEINAEEVLQFPGLTPLTEFSEDLDGDGMEERIIEYSYLSSAGCGCGSKPLVLLQNSELVLTLLGEKYWSKKISDNKEVFGKALSSLTLSCDPGFSRKWSVVTIDGIAFLLADYDTKEASRFSIYPYVHTAPLNRDLYTYSDGKFTKMCSHTASFETVVAHEVLERARWGALNYNPIE